MGEYIYVLRVQQHRFFWGADSFMGHPLMTTEDYFHEILYFLDFSMEEIIYFHILIWKCVQAIGQKVRHGGTFRFGDNSE